jgi:hypothetical protein
MNVSGDVDIALGILDHQLIDADERRCGKVDDLDIEGIGDGRPRVASIVSGPDGWRGRGRIGRLCAFFARGRTITIRWEDVDEVRADVHLRRRAEELGLGAGDDRARAWVERIPGSSL